MTAIPQEETGPITFIEAVLTGQTHVDELLDWIATWPQQSNATSIPEHLGMTPAEGALWTAHPESLQTIIKARAHARSPIADKEASTRTPAPPAAERKRKKRSPLRKAVASHERNGKPVPTRTMIPFLRPGYPPKLQGGMPYPACTYCHAPIRRINSLGWTHIPTSFAPWRTGHFLMCRSNQMDHAGRSISGNTIAAPFSDLRPAKYHANPSVGHEKF